jgi:long-chain fatty acid transport protein
MAMPSATIGYTSVEYTAPNGVSEETENPWRVLPSFFVSRPGGNGRCAYGIGVNVPFGQLTEWKDNGLIAATAPYKAQMFTLNTTPAFAFRLCDCLSVGAGANLMYSELEFNQLFSPVSPTTFEGDGWGFGATLGLTWQVGRKQRIALVYRSPVSIDYDGDFSIRNPPPGIPAAQSDFATEIEFPSVVGIGYGIQATEKLRLEADVEWIEHSRNSAIELDIGVNNPVLQQALGGTRAIDQDWDDTVAVDVGADYRLNDDCVLRAGYTWLPTPVPESTLMTTLPEGDVHFLGVGAGLGSGRNKLDLACTYSISEDVTVQPNRPNSPPGEYDITSMLFVVSYLYSF